MNKYMRLLWHANYNRNVVEYVQISHGASTEYDVKNVFEFFE